MLNYELLEKLYYKNKQDYNNEYLSRFNGISTIRFNIEINKNPAFCVITPEILNQLFNINTLNNRLTDLTNNLPGIALNQYIKKCLIEEIVLTNEIEGVVSTRRDITEVIENVKTTNNHKRLIGLINKYLKLNSEEELEIKNCQDIRDIYKDLLWEEVQMDNPENLPDGVYFRKSGVDVKNQFGKVIHNGIAPEDEIIRAATKALDILNNDKINILIRIAVFHYLFGYIHPFYDGNGRTSRFISSYLLSKNFNILTGYRLAYTIKENISLYYNSFKISNNIQNKGDLTPFIISFFEIVIKMLDKLCLTLAERTELLEYYYNTSYKMSSGKEAETSIIFIIFQETLFGDIGISIDGLIEASEKSRYKVRQTVSMLDDMGLLDKQKIGKKLFYRFDMDAVSEKYNM